MGSIREVGYYDKMDPDHRELLREMRKAILSLQQSRIPPDDPTNLSVSPIAQGNKVQFTRPTGATHFTLYISNTPTRTAASSGTYTAVDLGTGNTYNDVVGKAGFTRYYWVQAWNGNVPSRIIGPKSGTTLAVGADTAPPAPVPPSSTVTLDQSTGLPADAAHIAGRGKSIL